MSQQTPPSDSQEQTRTLLGDSEPNEALAGDAPQVLRIGRFVVLRALGEGGMSIVYAAYDEALHRKVAVKLLRVSKAGQARILREAQAMARLSHPNVAQVYETGDQEGRLFLVLEHIEGRSLAAWAKERPHTLREILDVYVQAGRGLSAAHAVGVMHRDFKPGNAMIDRDGRVRVFDFGLARLTDELANDGDPARPDLAITQLGTVMGTPAYMSPEQFRGQVADALSDQFSFCVALYETLCGQRPFEGATIEELAMHVQAGALRSAPREAELPPWILGALRRGLSTDPSDRWPSMEALLAELAPDRELDPSATPRLQRRLLAALGLAFFATWSYVVTSRAFRSGDGPTLRDFWRVSFVMCGLVLAVAFVLRRPLAQSRYHRSVLTVVSIAIAQLLVVRNLAFFGGLSLQTVVFTELSTLAATATLGAVFVARWLGAFAVLAAFEAGLAAFAWEGFRQALNPAYVLLALVVLVPWFAAGRRLRRPRVRTGPGV